MLSICCTPPRPDFQDMTIEDHKKFCRLVYLLRKRGYQIIDAQKIAYTQVLSESILFHYSP